MPAPAISVSWAWAWGLSPAPMAAATPPWAQAEEAPVPNGLGERTVTGKGASLRAVNRPASPAPTISAPSASRVLSNMVMCGPRPRAKPPPPFGRHRARAENGQGAAGKQNALSGGRGRKIRPGAGSGAIGPDVLGLLAQALDAQPH